MCVSESFDCSYMLHRAGFWAGNLFLLEAPRVLSPYRSLFPSPSLSLFYLCHSACLSFFFFFLFFLTPLSAQRRSCMPQLRWNGVDVISIALLETSISSQTGLGWLGERIKSRIARPKRFQFETGGPCLTSQSLGHVQLDAFDSIQHICGIKRGEWCWEAEEVMKQKKTWTHVTFGIVDAVESLKESLVSPFTNSTQIVNKTCNKFYICSALTLAVLHFKTLKALNASS